MIENAKKFLESLETNEEAQKILAEAKGMTGVTREYVLAEAAKKAGCDATEEDFLALLASVRGTSDKAADAIAELNPEEMEKVAGGGSCDGFFLPGCDGFFAHENCNLGRVVDL